MDLHRHIGAGKVPFLAVGASWATIAFELAPYRKKIMARKIEANKIDKPLQKMQAIGVLRGVRGT